MTAKSARSSLYRAIFFFLSAVIFFFPSVPFADDAVSGDVPKNLIENATKASTGGAGDLLVAPTRVLLEDRTRSAQITLSNTGSKEATYRVSFIHLHMNDNGQYEETSAAKLPSLGEKSADDMLRFSPRQVTLKPGESQVIKVVLRKPETLADGEYRSHLSFAAVPEKAIGEDVEAAKTVKAGQIGIQLIPVYGVSIPVVVRQGSLKAQAGITNLKMNGKSLSFTVTRNGNKSLYGDIIATYMPNDGEAKIVGEARGIAVFVPNQRRNVTLSLDETVNGGSLTLEYLPLEGDEQTLAKTTLKL